MPACSACGQDNPALARFCLACGTPIAPAAPPRRKLVTLLFCDMSGSTAAGERLDAESIRMMMLQYFETMRLAIERHGGTVEKFIGDAVMAVFGVPVAREDDALRATRAACDMQDSLGELNAAFERRYGHTIALRIGVNSGEVVAGDVTSRQTVVTGDAVNVAARLEQAAAPGDVLLGEATYALVRASVDAERVGPLVVKGKTLPLTAFRLRGVAPAPAARPGSGALVGRRRELRKLEAALAHARATGAAKTVTVVGEAGVGKSRLAEELAAAAAPTGWLVLRGRCLSYGEGITYWPIGEIVRAAAGIRDEDSREAAVERLHEALAGAPSAALVAERIGQAIGLVGGTVPEAETGWAVRAFLEAVSARTPALVIVDDLQWAEPALVELLASVGSVREPALLVCLARPELEKRHPDWRIDVRLETLPGGESASLLDAALGAPVDPALAQRIVHAGGGNPLFLEELATMLADRGDLRIEAGRWVAAREVDAIELPPTLAALLGARIDQLDEGVRDVAETGAVEGEVFHAAAVDALLGEAARQLPGRILALAKAGFVSDADDELLADVAYRFRHLLLRDAVYRATPKTTRAALHERFADWLVDRLRERAREVDEVLGYHLEQAYRLRCELGPANASERTLARRAGTHLADAGSRALGRLDVRAALSLLRRSAGLLHDAGGAEQRRAAALLDMSTALTHAGRLEESLAAARDAAAAARVAGDGAGEQHALLGEVWIRQWVDAADSAEVERAVRSAIPVFEDAGDERGLARAWRLRAEAFSIQDRGRDCIEAAERAAAHARRAGDRHEEAESIMKVFIVGTMGPMPTSEMRARGEELVARDPGRYLESVALAALGAALALEGRVDDGLAVLRRSEAILDELGLHFYRVSASVTLAAHLLLLAGRAGETEAILREAYDELDRLGETGVRPTAAALLALALIDQGRTAEAAPLAAAAREVATADDALSQVLWRRAQALVEAADGRADDAVATARAAVAIAERTDDLSLHGGALVDLATVLRGAGREDVRSHLDRALALFAAKGDALSTARARALLAGTSGR